MNIILEGPDNAGKTTLAQTLRDKIPNIKYYHPGGPPKDVSDEARCMREQATLLAAGGMLMDRLTCISQQVYSPQPDQTFRERALTNALRGNVLIFCRPCNDRLMRVEDFTWRDGESEEHKQKIIRNQMSFIERYDRMMGITPHITYDFESVVADFVVDTLVQAYGGNVYSMGLLAQLMHMEWLR
jgi:adenylate kinase family enzyme